MTVQPDINTLESNRQYHRDRHFCVLLWIWFACVLMPLSWSEEASSQVSGEWESFTIRNVESERKVQVRSRQLLVCLSIPPTEWSMTKSKSDEIRQWSFLIPRKSHGQRPRAAYRQHTPSLEQWIVVELPPEISLLNAIHQLQNHAAVIHVEPNYQVELVQATPDDLLPNDFYFDRSWGLNNTGQFEGTVDADIDLPEAWSLGTGSRDVKVAVIDTGIDFFHPDIRDNLWVNPDEIPGNGMDDDQNGYVDDVYGFDFVSDDGDPFDDQGHGTHVAGIIGAVANNRKGSAGVSQEVSLMAIKSFGVSGSADVATVVRAMRYAIDHGADIINASWGVDIRSELMRTAVEEAAQADVLFVAAGGNRQSEQLFYPAAFDDTVGVGATDKNDQRTRFSNYGSFIDLAAPGQTIFSTLPDNRFGFLSGTSMAAPHVTGAAVLALARHPDWTARDLTRMLLNAVDPIQPNKPIGSGRLNAFKAQQIFERLPRAELDLPEILGSVIHLQGSADGENFSHYEMSVGSGPSPLEWQKIHQSKVPVTSDALVLNYNTEDLNDGIHTFRLEVTDTFGQTNTVKQTVEIANVEITSPKNNDVLRSGERVVIRGSAFGKSRSYKLEYGMGVKPLEWTKESIELNPDIETSPFQQTLGFWDTSALAPNQLYSLRLTATDASGVDSEETVIALHLEKALKPNFPIYYPIGKEFTPEDWHPVVAEDLDQDGDNEIIVVESGDLLGTPTFLCVYDHEGSVVWKYELGDSVPFQDFPLTGDLDGDGFMEIFTEGGTGGDLMGFHHDGTPLDHGWPVQTGSKSLGKSMGDLDGDGSLELIALTHESPNSILTSSRQLMVIKSDGSIPITWNLHSCSSDLETMELLPAIGNLDEDEDLEIVSITGCNSIGIFDISQPDSVKTNAFINSGKLITSPVIGDLDQDGVNEIILTANGTEDDVQGGIHVFNSFGEELPGFPALVEEHFDSSPALADLDGDGDLEIIASSHRSNMIHVIHHHGFPMEGWPVGRVRDGLLRATPLVADVDGDQQLDVMIPTYGSTFSLIQNGDRDRTSGLRAWNADGEPVHFQTASGFDRIWMGLPSGNLLKIGPLTLTDLEGDGFLDVVGSTSLDLKYSLEDPRISIKDRRSIYAWSLNAPYRKDLIPWPTYQKDNVRSGRFGQTILINQAPVIRPILSQTIAQGSTFFPINLLRYGSDPDDSRNDLNWNVSGSQDLVVTIDEELIVSIAPPDNEWTGEETLVFTLTDPDGASAQTRATFRTLAGYNPPKANMDFAEMDEDTIVVIPVLQNDQHPENLPLKILELSPSLNGNASITNDGEIQYKPAENYFGSDTFQYVIIDDEGGMAIGEVQITLNPVNDPPLPEVDRIILTEDGSIEFDPLANDRDPDGDAIKLINWTQPSEGTMERLESGLFLYKPRKDYSGADQFTYLIEDSIGVQSEGQSELLVKGINDAPVAQSQRITMNRNREQNVTFSAIDPDGDPLDFEIIDGPENGRVLAFPAVATYIPEFGFSGSDQFTYRAHDGKVDGPVATVEIVVKDENNPPDVEDTLIVTAINQSVEWLMEADDVDEDSFHFTIQSAPEIGVLTIEEETLTYEPELDFTGTLRAIIEATDSFGATTSAEFTIEVTDENTAPEITDQGIEIFGNKSESFELSITDRENNPLTFEFITLPENGTLSGEAPNLTYHPFEDFFGFDRIQYIASDGELESTLGTVVIEVQYPNHKPTGSNQAVNLQMNRPKTFTLDVEDEDNDILQRVILEGPDHGILSGLEDTLIYTPDPNFTGTDDFTWRVWDGFGYSNTGKVTLRVTQYDPDFRLEIESINMIANQQLQITITSEPGRRYTLQSSPDLQNWTDLESLDAFESTLSFFDNIHPEETHQYYRAMVIR